MYNNYYRKQQIKSIIIITFLLLFAILSTYFIYNKFSKSRQIDIDTGEMEVVFHEKDGNLINIDKFTPVTDSVGLSSKEYSFTINNKTSNAVRYKIVLEPNYTNCIDYNCINSTIPYELLKLSLRKNSNTPTAGILSEYPNNVIHEDKIDAFSEIDYSIRMWPINSNFLVDKNSNFSATIKVIEE